MRDRDYETMIEIPLTTYRELVEELTEYKVRMLQVTEDKLNVKAELNELQNAHSKLTDLYEQVVVELESYKKTYDKEKK